MYILNCPKIPKIIPRKSRDILKDTKNTIQSSFTGVSMIYVSFYVVLLYFLNTTVSAESGTWQSSELCGGKCIEHQMVYGSILDSLKIMPGSNYQPITSNYLERYWLVACGFHIIKTGPVDPNADEARDILAKLMLAGYWGVTNIRVCNGNRKLCLCVSQQTIMWKQPSVFEVPYN